MNAPFLPLPRFIGLCGNPKAGKSLVQEILQERYGYTPVDDGHVLREFAVEKLGLSWDDVQTQAGKAGYTEILGKNWQNRDILGTLGAQLEDMFGEHIMPFIATRNLANNGRFSFGSVRKSQGQFYRDQGGLVVEVQNPLAKDSPYAFDRFDRSYVDAVIVNDALTRMDPEMARFDLVAKIDTMINRLVTVGRA